MGWDPPSVPGAAVPVKLPTAEAHCEDHLAFPSVITELQFKYSCGSGGVCAHPLWLTPLPWGGEILLCAGWLVPALPHPGLPRKWPVNFRSYGVTDGKL